MGGLLNRKDIPTKRPNEDAKVIDHAIPISNQANRELHQGYKTEGGQVLDNYGTTND